MDHNAEIEKRIRKTNTPKALVFTELLKSEHPELSDSFLRILSEYTSARIEYGYMYQQVSRLFSSHPDVIGAFSLAFPRAKSTKNVNVHDFTEMLRTAKKVKIEDDSRIAITETGSTSNASTSYASNYAQSPCCCSCHPRKGITVASGSSSSSRARNAAKAYRAQKKETTQLRDRTLYVTETKAKFMDDSEVYQHFTELVIEISEDRTDTCEIMERASKLLQGYPELIESFNTLLPDGYRVEY